MLGNLRHAKSGDVARLHVQVLQLAGEVVQAFDEFGFQAATDGRGGIRALADDGRGRTGKSDVGNQSIERIAVGGSTEGGVLADPIEACLGSPQLLRDQSGVGPGSRVARAEIAVEFVQGGSAEAAVDAAAGAKALLADDESA